MQTNNKLREALEMIASFPMPPPIELAQQTAVEMRDVAIAALVKPLRNCDVGTAEEQTRRMEAEYCHVQKSCYESPSGRECPLHKAEVDCRLIWAQMPYGEGGAK